MSLLVARFLLLFLIPKVLVAFAKGPTSDYCNLGCEELQRHTVCVRKDRCGPIGGCSNVPVTPAFREEMVDLHNHYRDLIASGKEGSVYANPGATNMHAVSYDMELEYIASCWAYSCPHFKHDHCRRTERWEFVGQNIFKMRSTKKKKFQNDTHLGVKSWFDEITYIDTARHLKEYRFVREWGHFSALLWAETKYIGCAHVEYEEVDNGKTWYVKELYCDYGPGGNIEDEPVYQFAADASQIASACEVRNDEFKSLCGIVEPIPKETNWAGADMIRISSLLVFTVAFAWILSCNLK